MKNNINKKNVYETTSGYPPKFIEKTIGIVVDRPSDRHNLKYLFKSLRYKLKININKNIKIKFSCCVLIFTTAEIRGVSILCG